MISRSICIVGTGYVGMASAIGFADLGHRVTGFDIDLERIRGLQRGVTPYRENGIEAALRRHVRSGAITFHETLAGAAGEADFLVVAVGTPSLPDGAADVRALVAAVDALEPFVHDGCTVVIRSTVPPGTTDALAERHPRIPFVFAPEFLREGTAVADFLNPDRIIAGARAHDEGERYAALLAALDRPVIVTGYRNAELIKAFSNAYLAMKISFANEVASMCEAVDADALEVLDGVGRDRRIGTEFLRPGIGFGGPCFDKDVRSLHHMARSLRSACTLLGATLQVNAAQPRRIVDMLDIELGGLRGTRVAVWGLAFKAGTDDVRDSLALRIIDDLVARGAMPTAYDPAVPRTHPDLRCAVAGSALDALDRADALLVLTEWPEFADVSPWAIAAALRRGLVVDGRNLLDPNRIAAAGLRYRGVGRRPGLELPLATAS